MTDKYTRTFADFGSYPWPGKNVPEYHEHRADAGDGNPGTQWMTQHIIAQYGPRHIVSGIQVLTTTANAITGVGGYFMFDGAVLPFTAASGTIAANEYAFISGDGTLNFAAMTKYGSGVIIAESGVDGRVDVATRWDGNFEHQVSGHVHRLTVQNFTGTRVLATALSGVNAKLTNITGTIIYSTSQLTGTYTRFENTVNFNAMGMTGVGEIAFTDGGVADRFYDEDDLSSNDESGLASQQSIKAYVDNHADVVKDLSPQLGADLDLNDHAFAAILTAGENVYNGAICYLKTADQKMWKAKGDDEATSKGLLGIASGAIVADAPGTFILEGFYTTGTATYTAGNITYVSDGVAGETVNEAGIPDTAGDIVRILGYAISTTKLFFKPGSTYIEI